MQRLHKSKFGKHLDPKNKAQLSHLDMFNLSESSGDEENDLDDDATG